MHLGRDASHAQRRTAWHLARAARALRASAPGLTFEVEKAASAVVRQWKELATCRYRADTDSTEVGWKAEAITALGIDIAEVRKEFDSMVRRGPNPARWRRSMPRRRRPTKTDGDATRSASAAT